VHATSQELATNLTVGGTADRILYFRCRNCSNRSRGKVPLIIRTEGPPRAMMTVFGPMPLWSALESYDGPGSADEFRSFCAFLRDLKGERRPAVRWA